MHSYSTLAVGLSAMMLATYPCPAANVTTFAGTGRKGFSGDGGPAAAAQLNNPFAVSRGPDGFIYFCDVDNQRVRRVSPGGILSTYAGNGTRGYSGDGGPATSAALNEPYELSWDKAGNLYFVERLNHLVRRVEAKTGRISTMAGHGMPGFAGDESLAREARFNQPHSLAFDSAGDLYICDVLNHRVRRIESLTGVVSTWCGTGARTTAADGAPITGSSVHGPRALAFGQDGKAWLALREGNALLQLDVKSNTLRRVAGNGRSGFTGNGGSALTATLAGPKCVALDDVGKVYLADTESHSIRVFDPIKGTIDVLVGNGSKGDGPDDADASQCLLARPHGVYVDKDGALYIGDSENHRIRVLRK